MFKKCPHKCPNCGTVGTMMILKQQRTKFSVGKAIIGTCIAGPLGLVVGGCIGNKKLTYRCSACGFEKDPDTLI